MLSQTTFTPTHPPFGWGAKRPGRLGMFGAYKIAYDWPLTGLLSWAFSRRVLLIPLGVTNAALLLRCFVFLVSHFYFSFLSSLFSLLSSLVSRLSSLVFLLSYLPRLPLPLITLAHPCPPLFTLTYLHLSLPLSSATHAFLPSLLHRAYT